MRVININTLKNYIEFLSAKDEAGGYLPPDRFNEAAAILTNKVAKKYYGLPEEYRPANPQPSISLDITQAIIDYVANLRVQQAFNVPPSGRITRPVDYLHASSGVATSLQEIKPGDDPTKYECCHGDMVTTKVNGQVVYKKKWKPVTFITDKEQWMWLDSPLREPTKDLPAAVILGNDEIQIYPTDIKTFLLVYIRYPKTPKWNYTIQGGIPVYEPIGSENIELPEVLADEMAVTIMERLGISIREQQLIDFSRYTKNSGK